MAYKIADTFVGFQPLTDISTTQNHPFGTVAKGSDPTYGEATFVYVKGVSSGAAALAVTYNPYTGVTTLTGARSKGLVGVFLTALDATTKFGWLQVSGVADVQVAGTVAAGNTVYLTSTAGKLDDAVVAGDIVYNANFATADATPSANHALVALARPYVGDTDNT
jgi:uncharacterized membrane protein